jgi:hypothetical protein
MIGTLTKLKEGWYVKFFEDGTVIHTYLPLHPDDVKQINRDAQVFDNIEARIAAYPNVEFDILIEEETSEHYAKLIPSKEQQKQLITEIMDLDAKNGMYDTVNDTVNKMAEEMYGKGKVPDYEEGFIDGYNKAQETLYTEQDINTIKRILIYDDDKNDTEKILEAVKIIQSLKQPKKD